MVKLRFLFNTPIVTKSPQTVLCIFFGSLKSKFSKILRNLVNIDNLLQPEIRNCPNSKSYSKNHDFLLRVSWKCSWMSSHPAPNQFSAKNHLEKWDGFSPKSFFWWKNQNFVNSWFRAVANYIYSPWFEVGLITRSFSCRNNLHKTVWGDFQLSSYSKPNTMGWTGIPSFWLGFHLNFQFDQWSLKGSLGNALGHFWYLLILKRSFLAMVAIPGDSRPPIS